MQVRCLYDKLVPISQLKLNPNNRNIHSKEQIQRLAEILKYQGWRYCVKVSNQSGMVSSGHGRVEAAIVNGWTEVPVNYQDYDTPDQEYADTIADNAIASWAELDLAKIHMDVKDLKTDFEVKMLGIEDFSLGGAPLEEELNDEDQFSTADDDDGNDLEKEDSIPDKIEPRVKSGEIYKIGDHRVINGDCLAVLKTLESDSLDSLVTDPPAGIAFMGKEWDEDKGGSKEWIAWLSSVMKEALRVLKPGAHGLVWAIPRTSHWTTTALEDAGFEIRDVVTHIFGSGFPKSMDISKAIDKAAGAERDRLGENRPENRVAYGKNLGALRCSICGNSRNGTSCLCPLSAAITPEAKQWQGWGTALKPASEHWILVRKPIEEKTVAANVLKHGTGGINIDASRIRDGKEVHLKQDASQGGASRFFYCAKAIVLDCFGGSGTTLIAAHLKGFSTVLIEQSPEYCDIILARAEYMTDKSAAKEHV